MTSGEDIPIDDALIQLLRDNLLNNSLTLASGLNFLKLSSLVMVNYFILASDESELSDLDSVISQETRDGFNHGPNDASKKYCYQLESYSSPLYPLKEPKRSRRLGKDDKLAHQANLPFTVKVMHLKSFFPIQTLI